MDNITSTDEGDSVFRKSEKTLRSPDKSTEVPGNRETIAETGRMHIANLEYEEEQTFVELGNRISAINSIVLEARNIHKPIRDNLAQAVALYQKLRENREAIALVKITDATSVEAKRIEKINKASQTENGHEKPAGKSKREATKSPIAGRSTKKPRSSSCNEAEPNAEEETRTTAERPSNKSGSGSSNTADSNIEKEPWIPVTNRKAKKKEERRKPSVKIKGEAITIKAPNLSYAEVIKEMKEKIKPEEVGVNIRNIRRTRDGDLLIQMEKGTGQAEKLENAIRQSLGEKVQVKTLEDKVTLELKDMEETTVAKDIVQGLMRVTKTEDPLDIKVKKIRSAYGGTKQALVEIPSHLAITILKETRVRIGWVMCKVRKKEAPKRCFRCLENGHMARVCQGKDRSKACMKCGIDGHKAKDCKNEARCVICLEAGRPNVKHFIGSSKVCNGQQ